MAVIDVATQKLIADAYSLGLDTGRKLGYAKGYEQGVKDASNDFTIIEPTDPEG